MECYERYNWKIKNKIDKSSRILAISRVDVYNKPEIAEAFVDFCTNIGQKKASLASVRL